MKNKTNEPCYTNCANYSPRVTLSLEEFNEQLSLLENVHIKKKLQQFENQKKDTIKHLVWLLSVIGAVSSFYIGKLETITGNNTIEFLFFIILFIFYIYLIELENHYWHYINKKNLLLLFVEQNNLQKIKKLILEKETKINLSKENFPKFSITISALTYLYYIAFSAKPIWIKKIEEIPKLSLSEAVLLSLHCIFFIFIIVMFFILLSFFFRKNSYKE